MKNKFLLVIIFIILLYACEYKKDNMKSKNVDLKELRDIPQQSWDTLSNKKIYFGHQSVGYDIVDGITDIMQALPYIKLNVKDTKEPSNFETPIFAHSGVGGNKYPLLKCEDFKVNIENGIGEKVDIAFFKYCWADIQKDTDVEKILQAYVETITYLETKYPNVQFIYVTVPLQVPQSPLSLKGIIKRFLGYKYLGQEQENIKRNSFNEFLREKCKGKILFDLEKIESTYSNGERYIIKRKNFKYISLIPEYTNDGGHPNELGRKIIAKELLKLLISNMGNRATPD